MSRVAAPRSPRAPGGIRRPSLTRRQICNLIAIARAAYLFDRSGSREEQWFTRREFSAGIKFVRRLEGWWASRHGEVLPEVLDYEKRNPLFTGKTPNGLGLSAMAPSLHGKRKTPKADGNEKGGRQPGAPAAQRSRARPAKG